MQASQSVDFILLDTLSRSFLDVKSMSVNFTSMQQAVQYTIRLAIIHLVPEPQQALIPMLVKTIKGKHSFNILLRTVGVPDVPARSRPNDVLIDFPVSLDCAFKQ